MKHQAADAMQTRKWQMGQTSFNGHKVARAGHTALHRFFGVLNECLMTGKKLRDCHFLIKIELRDCIKFDIQELRDCHFSMKKELRDCINKRTTMHRHERI